MNERPTTISKDRNQLYPVMDTLTPEERNHFKLTTGEGTCLTSLGRAAIGIHAQWTGEKRAPKKGEWYLSGAFVEAYRARANLSAPYYIAKLVKTMRKTVTTVSVVA